MGAVLVVEDDDEIRELVSEMLAENGFTVVTAANGQEALDRLGAAARPCVILLDLMMPVMDGWQLRSRLLADPSLRDIPVIVVSGAADLHESVDALKAARVLTKPVKWPALLESVQAHCH
jgi:CheY-like chemotaxis protein